MNCLMILSFGVVAVALFAVLDRNFVADVDNSEASLLIGAVFVVAIFFVLEGDE